MDQVGITSLGSMDRRQDVDHDQEVDENADAAADALNVALMSYMREHPVPSQTPDQTLASSVDHPFPDASQSSGAAGKRKRDSLSEDGQNHHPDPGHTTDYLGVLDPSLHPTNDHELYGQQLGDVTGSGGVGDDIGSPAAKRRGGRAVGGGSLPREGEYGFSSGQPMSGQEDGNMTGNESAAGGDGTGKGGVKREVKQTKRAEQNRKAQQNFRKRREENIKLLEAKVAEFDELKKQKDLTDGVISELRLLNESLRMENANLRSALLAAASQGARLIDDSGDLIGTQNNLLTAAFVARNNLVGSSIPPQPQQTLGGGSLPITVGLLASLGGGGMGMGMGIGGGPGGVGNEGDVRVGERGKESNERGETLAGMGGNDEQERVQGNEQAIVEVQGAIERLATRTQMLARMAAASTR